MIRTPVSTIVPAAQPAEDRLQRRLVEAIAEYHEAADAGRETDRDAFLEKYADIRDELSGYLDSFDLIRSVAPELRDTSDAPDPYAASAPPQAVVGDFRIIRELGRGGMGVVYEAEQISLGRRVALKVLPFAGMLDKQQLARFKNEARAAATLDHPNIVAIYSVGAERGVHYYAMQLIEGRSLAAAIAEMKPGRPPSAVDATAPPSKPSAAADTVKAALPTLKIGGSAAFSSFPPFESREYFNAVARLGIQAAEALDHAHQNGILHRDIKPANLLVDDAGKLWITDFGLARIEQDAGMTMTGDLLGTLRYMSPEQVLAKRVVVDHRSDIYSLGATLYELVTLCPAFTGDDRQELLRQIAFEEPRKPRQVNARIPQDLETIILKATEKNPADRYVTAQQFGDDLQRFAAGEPIRAKPPSLLDRLTKLSRRHQYAVWASIVVLGLTTVGLAISSFLIAKERNAAQIARSRAEASLSLSREAVDEMLTKVATTWMPDTSQGSQVQRQFLDRAMAIYRQLAKDPPDGDQRGADAGIAHERMSEIHHQLGELPQEVAALETAIAIFEELQANKRINRSESEELVRCYEKLSLVSAALGHWDGQWAKAQRATDRGIALAQRLRSEGLESPRLERDYASLLCHRARLLMNDKRFTEAAAVVAQTETEFNSRLRTTERPDLEDLLVGAELTDVLATIQLRHGKVDDAAETVTANPNLQFLELPNYADAKTFVERSADLFELLGEIRVAQAKPIEAVTNFRNALRLRKQRLGGRTPTQINLASFTDEPWGHLDPRPAAAYCSTQLRLASALQLSGRPIEAEAMLGEALQSAKFLDDTTETLNFKILTADAAAAVGEYLSDRKSSEAAFYFTYAAALWNEMRPQFPQVERFQSGLYGAVADWDWFRTTYPQYASLPGTRESLKPDQFSTAFWHRMLGSAWMNTSVSANNWRSAEQHYLKSAQLRDSGQALDWLHLVIIYHRLGLLEKAEFEYGRAVAQLNDPGASNIELESLRRVAARLLAEKDPIPTAPLEASEDSNER
jgi:serine/threonine protein kinase